jgi:hypothetical protein
MNRRLELQSEFESILGSKYVYFQPPESIKLHYPCIVYKRTAGETLYADNSPYLAKNRYEATLIDENPDSEFVDKMLRLPYAAYQRHFNSDGLNHDVFYVF